MMPDADAPPDETSLSGIARFRKRMFDDGGLEEVFRHVRNIITSSLIMAAGLYTVKYERSLEIWGVLNISVAGYGVAFLGIVLFVLNLLEGIHQLAKFRWHFMFQIALVVIYLMITIRVEQIVLNFRTS
ncbi:MAG: hypothetical protein JWL86_4016 [Rhizobium sp.]|nr:hypothetical protein [Rhizobium sp.]